MTIRLGRQLIVMAKQPLAGYTKTRLCPPLTPIQATELYTCFLHDVLAVARRTKMTLPELDLAVAHTPSSATAYFNRLAPDFLAIAQVGDDLSVRLDHVLTSALGHGYGQVIATNSDSPTLPVNLIEQAFHLLDRPDTDVVLGPCDDGGYYLIGVKGKFGAIVRDVEMSTDRVLADTLALAEAAGLCVELLPTWYDVDDVATLARLQRDLAEMPARIAPRTRQFLRLTAIAGATYGG